MSVRKPHDANAIVQCKVAFRLRLPVELDSIESTETQGVVLQREFKEAEER